VGYVIWSRVQQSEANQQAQAMKDYTEGKVTAASREFEHLATTFPDSDQVGNYRFMAAWCTAKGYLQSPEADVIMACTALNTFIQDFNKDPQMPVYAPEVGTGLAALAENFGKRVGVPTSLEPLKSTVKLEESRTLAHKMLGPEAFASEDAEKRFNTALGAVRSAVDKWDRHSRALAHLRGLKTNADGIRQARAFIRDKSAELPNFAAEPEVADILMHMEQGHLASVVFEKAADAPPATVPAEKGQPSIVFELLLGDAKPPAPPPDDPVKLALVRGVLYALRQTDGTIKWARRVGIDTTTLPVHVPASPTAGDRFLVLSSDNLTLTALDADGNPVWYYRLTQPCLGRPLIVEDHAYLPTFDGVIHELELARGTLLGRYKLDQRLTVGGAIEPPSKVQKVTRLYIPADDSCLYVLDVTAQRCERVLYTDHPAGSLRSEPLIIPSVILPGAGEAPGLLVLNQADGLDSVRLRAFDLPLTSAHQRPRDLNPEPRLPGWTWFPPHQDEEKIVFLSDRGMLGLFGIRQANNKDQPLFPLLGQPTRGNDVTSGLNLDPLLLEPTVDGKPAAASAGPTRGRSQLVYGQGDDLWVLARGLLQRIELGWDARQGRRPIRGWKRALSLGSPLHESQVAEDTRRGRATLFLVTQPLDQQTCVATAVDDEDGRIRWQRQLGLVCLGEPVVLTPPDGREGGPLLLLLDQAGGLFALDPGLFPLKAKEMWQTGGQYVAPALVDNPAVPPVLIPGPDGHIAYELACPGDGKELWVRQIEWEAKGRRLIKPEAVVLPLPSPLAGTPAVVGTSLVFPMAGGSLGRVLLPLGRDSKVNEGPNWRYHLASRETRGHVLPLGGDRFVATDGGRGMECWEWSREGGYHSLSPNALKAEVNDRISGVPVVLPGGGTPRIAVADIGGTVTLFGVRADGTFDKKRTWDLKGKIADGVFVRVLPDGKVRLGQIVGGWRLVWLDPAQGAPEWAADTTKPIIGQPQIAGNHLIVVDQSGTVAALDLTTGKQQGAGYKLPGSVAPTTGVVSFGAQRALLPLTDGTALMLRLDLLTR
jgi:outer membrane protein assembly factor BamB